MSLLKMQDISHSFEFDLYKGVNLEIKKAESLAILGVSGSGKSTILNHASSFLKPNTGIVSIGNKDNIYTLKQKEILALRKNTLGIIFQAHYLFRGFSALENLKVANLIANTSLEEDMLKDFGIFNALNQKIGSLSGGQQQRLSIARILTKKPKVIIADEPTGNLDSKTARAVMDYLFTYIKQNDACLLLATHDENLAKMCNACTKIYDKKLINLGDI